MGIKVFISATREDLEDTLVDSAKLAIGKAGANAKPIEMGTWSNDFISSVKLCRQMLEASTHYLGIFGYRRGWVPDELKANATGREYDQSITEHEFWIANDIKRVMAVFVPEHGSAAARNLKALAKKQKPAEKKAQKDFLNRVLALNKGVMPFSTETRFHDKAVERVKSWTMGGIRRAGRGSTRKPVDLTTLGRRPQEKKFRGLLFELDPTKPSPPVAVLIHGPVGSGHEHLAKRMAGLIDKEVNKTLDPIDVTVSPTWQDNSPATLIHTLTEFFEAAADKPPTLDTLATVIATELDRFPVTIIVQSIQRLEGGLDACIQFVWHELQDRLPSRTANPFTLIVTDESPGDIDESQVTEVDNFDVQNSDMHRPVVLPRLGGFIHSELKDWFERHGRNEAQAEAAATTILNETNGEAGKVIAQLRSGI